jgi:hypothetical protein
MTLIVINIVFSLSVSNISIGGHLGGLVAGVLGAGALISFRRYYPAVGRAGVVRGAVVVVIAIVSVAIAYARVKGLS